jgi:hypothetical protein
LPIGRPASFVVFLEAEEKTMSTNHEIRLGDAIKEGWRLFLAAPEVFVVLTLVSLAAGVLRSMLGPAGQLAGLVVNFILPGAFCLVAEEARKEGKASFAALDPLANLAPQLLMAGITGFILVSVGFVLLILPGFYAILAVSFTYFFVILEKQNFWEAIKSSHELMKENWLGTLGLLFFLFLFAVSGILFAGIGLLVTAPLSFLTFYCVFRQLRSPNGTAPNSEEVQASPSL